MDVQLKILRYNPEKDTQPYFQDFTVKNVSNDWRLLDVLQEIKWQQDGTLTYRYSCAHGICGSDGMKVNGKNRLACCLLLKYINTKQTIEVELFP